MAQILALILVGLSVGLGNFAASVAIGLGGVDKSLRWRIALVFGGFETLMPIIGLVIGHKVAGSLGSHANLIGGVLLAATGLYLLIGALRHRDDQKVKEADPKNIGKLLLTGLSLSIDNLIVGFSLGTYHESLWVTAAVIGVTCVTMSLIGLEIGSRLSSKVEEYSEALSGAILILIGMLIFLKVL